jgi:hypothetical protein
MLEKEGKDAASLQYFLAITSPIVVFTIASTREPAEAYPRNSTRRISEMYGRYEEQLKGYTADSKHSSRSTG